MTNLDNIIFKYHKNISNGLVLFINKLTIKSMIMVKQNNPNNINKLKNQCKKIFKKLNK